MRVLQTLIAFSGNAPPQLAVTHELVARGHEVRVVAHRAARARVVRSGAEMVEFQTWRDFDLGSPDTDYVRDWEARTPIGAALRLRDRGIIEPLRGSTREFVEAIRNWRPDVVVFDWLLPGAAIAAEQAAVPAVALVHCPYPFAAEGFPPLFSGLSPMGGPLGTMRDRIVGRLMDRFSAAGLPTLNKVRAEHGLAPLSRWDEQLLSAAEIEMLTAAEIDFSSRAPLPANVHYVGAAFEPFDERWTSPWPETNHDPLIVIGLSTSYMNHGPLAQRILDAVEGLPVRALLTAGPAINAGQLRLPANARAASFVPHRAVFPSASLVITHAGWQTVNAALADGVPLLCIPDSRDQPDNAARVIYLGAGVRARKNTSPARLRKTITNALENPELKRKAAKFAAALTRQNGATTTVTRLEQLTSVPAT